MTKEEWLEAARLWGSALNLEVRDALHVVNLIFLDAIASGKHQPGDWRELGETGIRHHLSDHYFGNPTDGEDHLANLVCRGLMLLQLREEAKRDKRRGKQDES